jgi:hypothetical protein
MLDDTLLVSSSSPRPAGFEADAEEVCDTEADQPIDERGLKPACNSRGDAGPDDGCSRPNIVIEKLSERDAERVADGIERLDCRIRKPGFDPGESRAPDATACGQSVETQPARKTKPARICGNLPKLVSRITKH